MMVPRTSWRPQMGDFGQVYNRCKSELYQQLHCISVRNRPACVWTIASPQGRTVGADIETHCRAFEVCSVFV